MCDIARFIESNVKKTVEELNLIITFNDYFVVKAIGYPMRYMLNEVYYKDELVTDDTEIDINELKLIKIDNEDVADWPNAEYLIAIPKGAKLTFHFDSKDYNEMCETFDSCTIKYNDIEFIDVAINEIEHLIDTIDLE